jgi:hypothetical protein
VRLSLILLVAQSGTVPHCSEPLDAGELEVTDVILRERTIGLVELRSQSSAADPVTGCVLFENGCVERVQAVQLKDDTAVQQRGRLHRELQL